MASIIFEQGARITPFVRPWSSMTIKESNPLDRGRSVIRSPESCLKGRIVEEGIGTRVGEVGWVTALFCWHTVHPVTKFKTKTERPNNQKLCSRCKNTQGDQRGGNREWSGVGRNAPQGAHTCGP